MPGISFVIVTGGTNDDSLNQIIDSVELQNIPEYEVLIIGGRTTTVNRKNTIHVPFNESVVPKPWLTRKKNIGAHLAQYDVVVIMHDYYVFDPDWYEEFVKFGLDWDICIHQSFTLPEQGSSRANGWRAGPIPGYPEIPYAMTIPWDIDCFIPYMAIQGAYWVAKREVMLQEPLDESLLMGENDDIEWSARIVPGWLGQKFDQVNFKIVSNPKCVARFNKVKPPYPGNPDWAQLERQLEPLWDLLRQGYRRAGIYHYERSLNKVIKGGQ